MTVPSVTPNNDFDNYSSTYDQDLQKGIAVSGEGKEYFARRRVQWLSRRLQRLGFTGRKVLDFGCGDGAATPYLIDVLQAESVVGLDISAGLLDLACKRYGGNRASFLLSNDYLPEGKVDIAFSNGVFHHVPPALRDRAIQTIFDALRPGGLFALWENNPWNPGTRFVMSRIPFDRDAVCLSPRGARRLVRASGFKVVRTDALFIFPHVLRGLRPLERLVCRVPLGAQYMVLCRKP
jgi:SAM-dependent methyltransferase